MHMSTMPAHLQDLDAEIKANTYPFCNSPVFDSQLGTGWIKTYRSKQRHLSVTLFIYFAFCCWAATFIIYNQSQDVYNNKGKSETVEIYPYIVYACALLVLLLVRGIFLQNRGISNRNIADQESGLCFFHFYVYLQLSAFLMLCYCASKDSTVGSKILTVFAFLFWILGVALKALALKVRVHMVDMHQDSKQSLFKIIFERPRYFSDIQIKSSTQDALPF